MKHVLSLLLFFFALATTAQHPIPLPLAKIEKRLDKVFEKQLKSTKGKHLSTKILSAVAFSDRKHIEVRMNDHFSDFTFDSRLVSSAQKAVRKYLPKSYRKYTVSLLTCGMDISMLNDEDQVAVEASPRPWVTNISQPFYPTMGLFKSHLSLWASHGRYYDVKHDKWSWQRPKLFCTTEDLFIPTIVNPYLIPMLEQAGAVVFTPRERDIQRREYVIDNDNASSAISYLEVNMGQSWHNSPLPGFKSSAEQELVNGDNPFTLGTCRMATTTRSKSAYSLVSYQPTFEASGRYAVYVSYQSLPESIDDAHYTVWHKGEKTEFLVNQQMGGGTWVYLGTFDFDAGSSAFNRVVVTNRSGKKGVVSTDAVRFGCGMGNISRGGKTSGMPRCLEGARYYAQWAGMPSSVYNGREGTDDYADDINTRSHATNYIGGGSCYMPGYDGLRVPIELSLAVHSDAGFSVNDNDIIGSLAICTTAFNEGKLADGRSRCVSRDFASLLLEQLNSDLTNAYGKWNLRGIYDKNYSETRLPAVPSAIIETVSHQNFMDMRRAQDPQFKFTLARSLYKAILKQVSHQHQRPYIVSPLTPRHHRIEFVGDAVARLSWEPTPDESEPTSHANGYIVYMAEGDADFDNGTYVASSTHYDVTLTPGQLYRFKIAAVNRGGMSFPTSVLCALWRSASSPTALIVDAFHREASPQVVLNDSCQGFSLQHDAGIAAFDHCSWVGEQQVFDRKQMGIETVDGLGYSNDTLTAVYISGSHRDEVYTHARAISYCQRLNIVSSDSRAIESGLHPLGRPAVIDLILGLQRADGYSITSSKTFSKVLQQQLRHYLSQGGALLASGAYIGSDMLSGGDRAFMAEVLHCRYNGEYCIADNRLTGMGTTATFHHQFNDRHYAALSTDVLSAIAPAFSTMLYADGRSMCVAYQGSHRSITMGVPFECIIDEMKRKELMNGVMGFLLPRHLSYLEKK